MRWKKKGLSEIIATIAIALLTVGAVALIVAFVVPFVRDNLNSSTECLDYKEYYTFYEDFGYNCYSGQEYGISVQAGGLGDSKEEEMQLNKGLKGFKLEFVTSDINSVPVDVFKGESTGMEEGKVRMLNSSINEIELPDPRGVKTYVYNGTTQFTRVLVYPVLNSGRTCDASDEINIGGEICSETLRIN